MSSFIYLVIKKLSPSLQKGNISDTSSQFIFYLYIKQVFFALFYKCKIQIALFVFVLTFFAP